MTLSGDTYARNLHISVLTMPLDVGLVFGASVEQPTQ